MGSVQNEVRIARKPAEVWAFVTDLERCPEWTPFTTEMLEIRRPPDGGAAGTEYSERGPYGKSTWRIVESVPPRREVHVGDLGIAELTITMEVEPHGDGSLFRHRMDWTMKRGIVGWVVERVAFRRVLTKGAREMMENGKRILEAEAPAPPARPVA